MKITAKRAILLTICTLCFVLFSGLGVWQVERRAWKLDLIAKVDARVHAPPVALPPAQTWPTLKPDAFEYRHVSVEGHYLHDSETLVEALTERGPGFWVVTPMQTKDGVVLVNRGFVPPELRGAGARVKGQSEGVQRVTGLMRVSEPGGRFLRTNQPAQHRWYSRDVAAIAAAQGLSAPAPFFIDADATPPNPGGYPVGGLTVVSFRNTHLIYALTWFGLAAMALVGLVLLLRSPYRRA